jgi:hypothetical protein
MKLLPLTAAFTLLAGPALAVGFDCNFLELCMSDDDNTCQEASYSVKLSDALTPSPSFTTTDTELSVAAREKLDDETWMFSGTRADGLIETLQMHTTGRAIYVQQVEVDGVIGSTIRHGICGVVE